MFGEEIETWPVNPLPDTTLVIIGIYITNLSYLKDGPSHFMEFPDSSMEESNWMLVVLDIAAIIPETDNQDLPDLIDLKVEQANKKKDKAERRRQK